MASKHPELAQTELIDRLPAACADEATARALIEHERWGGTPVCPHCGSTSTYRMTGATAERRGLLRCRERLCKKQFTVRVGTIFEDSKIELRFWCRTFWECAASKNGISALELSRKIQVTYRTALFLLNRVRHAMDQDGPIAPPPLTGTIEADSTFVGGRPRFPGKIRPKPQVLAVLQRGGDVRARVMTEVTAANVRKMLLENTDPSQSELMTDEANVFREVGKPFLRHGTTMHSAGEYVRHNDRSVHSNSAEGFFSRVKRKLHGTHHAVSRKHLHRYITEAAYLYNTRHLSDGERVLRLIRDTEGKRLHYLEPAQEPKPIRSSPANRQRNWGIGPTFPL